MDSFANALTNFATSTSQVLDEIFQEVVIDIGTRVITLTPVLTGRLKGNWQATVGSPSTKSLVRYDKTGDAAISDLIAKAKTFSAGEVAYIVNNLIYANFIELGGSPNKAPDGMVRVTAAEFEAIVRDVVKRRA